MFLSYRDSAARDLNHDRSSYPPQPNDKGKGRAYAEDEEETVGLMHGFQESIRDVKQALPPQWVALAAQVDSILFKIKPKSQ